MKIIELRQILSDFDDDDDMCFIGDNGDDYNIGSAIRMDDGVVFFGESDEGLLQAIEEFGLDNGLRDGGTAVDDDNAHLGEVGDPGPSDDDPSASGAVEGSDLACRERTCLVPDKGRPAEYEEM